MISMAFACLFVGTVASTSEAFVYAMALGFAYGSFQAINAAVYAHYFGRQHAGEIRGVTFVITIVGAALGPLPFGWAAGHGSYSRVLVVGCGIVCRCYRGEPPRQPADRPSDSDHMTPLQERCTMPVKRDPANCRIATPTGDVAA